MISSLEARDLKFAFWQSSCFGYCPGNVTNFFVITEYCACLFQNHLNNVVFMFLQFDLNNEIILTNRWFKNKFSGLIPDLDEGVVGLKFLLNPYAVSY